MNIGTLKLKNNVILAPMAGVTDLPCRLLCKEQGAGLVFTEMISAKGMHYNSENTRNLLISDPQEGTPGVQIFGSDAAILSEIVGKLNEYPVSLIDINMGCPAPKIVKNGEGCALMKDIRSAYKIISSVVKAASKPVTVKFRKGWDEDHVNAVEFARMAEEGGAAAVTVHGRTRSQFYAGTADWEIIKQVKESVGIPVIGNGDITSGQAARAMLDKTKADGIMIGRAAHGNPWIFKEVLTYLHTGESISPPAISEKIDTIIRHMDMLIGIKGERTAINEMRTHIAKYLKGFQNAGKLRNLIYKQTDKQGVMDVLQMYMDAEKESGT